MDQLTNRNPATPITIQGDININLLTLTTRQKFYNFLVENDLYTCITDHTRADPVHNTTSLIDVVLTTAKDTAVQAGTISPPLSDHLPTYAVFYSNPPRKKKNKTPRLTTQQYEQRKHKILSTIKANLIDAFCNPDPTATTAQTISLLQNTISQTVQAFQQKPRHNRRKPWCSSRIRRLIRKQHKLYQTQKNSTAHRKARKAVRRAIRQEKKAYLQEALNRTKNDPKKRTRILRSILTGRQQARDSPMMIRYEEKTFRKPVEIANALNDHFATVGKKTSKKVPEQKQQPERKTAPKPPSFSLQHTSTAEVRQVMRKINRNKASDIFDISPAIIRDLEQFLSETISDLFNRSVDEGDYPDPLKVTKLIELYKAKDRADPANYRPISLLPIIAKIFDTIINNQVMEHLIKNNIISPTQYAFRPDSSTVLTLETVLNKIFKHRRRKVMAILIDLSKAYDTVSHEKLLNKLEHNFNFSPTTIAYFRSYLTNRTQSTHTTDAKSNTLPITHGIPQGSTLSTTLFLLYINDVYHTVPPGTVFTFADDTTLVVISDTCEELQDLAQTQLTKLTNYFYSNNLVPNATKTNYIIFQPNSNSAIQLKVNNTAIEQVTTARLLGVTIQDDRKFHQHITKTIRKLQPIIYNLRHANKLLPTDQLKQYYYSNIYPILIYAIPIWGSAKPNSHAHLPLLRTQKKILRLLKNAPPRTPTKPLLKDLEILLLHNIFIFRVCVEMHPFIYPAKDANRPHHDHLYTLVAQVHKYKTRFSQKQTLFLPNIRPTTKTKRSDAFGDKEHFQTLYANIWNLLPEDIQNKTNLKTFRRLLRRHLLDKQQTETIP
jgi:hypothetical protein